MALSPITIISLISILYISSSSSQTTLKLSLTPISNKHIAPSQQSQSQILSYLTSSSLSRAHHLKNPKHNSNTSNSAVSLYPASYGGYSVTLGFGSPSQKLSFVMDTGSSLVWFPCTTHYLCFGCNFPKHNNISKFVPKLSSSARILGCSNKKCGWVLGPTVQCNGEDKCPGYDIEYGSGSTSGIVLSETLHFAEGDEKDFAVGCSLVSGGQPEGIAGFGRGPASLPVQMGLKKFSYCLVSHKFDDNSVSSELVLVRNSSYTSAKDAGISYTRFHKNPEKPAFEEYYYLSLRKITVGGKTVKIPYSFLTPDSDGNGGTIIDSGTTFTYMDDHIHDLVAKEFENQLSSYKRYLDLEKVSGLSPCFNITGKLLKFPELMFHFKGGAKLSLPLADYFSFLGNPDVLCMTIFSSEKIGSGPKTGPSIIIGNYQQQNIYLEYDLEKGRLGLKKQICK